METYVFRRRYVWQFPVRLFHWVNAPCIVVLIVTGLVIGDPPGLGHAQEAWRQQWFGIVRFVHFTAAWVCLANMLIRVYWAFVGNRHARWTEFVPISREHWKEIVDTLKIDVLQVDPGKLPLSLGHNALAGLTYFLILLLFLFQAVTGFALYAPLSESWFAGLFGWVAPLMGGEFAVRTWHHAAMWGFVLFTIFHVYLVSYHDYVEGRGTTSSMVGGWKFARQEEVDLERR
jgi:Ni/Fe-hydrogenase 1 B-type cytochrome subunit